MQTIGREIRLLPAWPKQWDVDFKLHAPYQPQWKANFGSASSYTSTSLPRHAARI